VHRATVLLADDNSAILVHVRAMLEHEPDFQVLATIEDGPAVLPQCAALHPDVLVLDISMGDVSGIDLAARLRDSGCISKIVFLTVHDDPDFVNAAMGAGGSAYVVKSRLNKDLIHAMHAALSDKLFVSPTLLFDPDSQH